MSTKTDTDYAPVKVHVVADDTGQTTTPKERHTLHQTFFPTTTAPVGSTPAQLILPHSPRRKRATVVASGFGSFVLADNEAQVQAASATSQSGCTVYTAPITLDIRNTTEIWMMPVTLAAPIPPALNQVPLAASTVASYNNNPYGVVVTVTGGAVTVIAVNGTTTGLTSGAVYVPAGGTLTITYTVAPALVTAVVSSSGSAPFTISVIQELES